MKNIFKMCAICILGGVVFLGCNDDDSADANSSDSSVTAAPKEQNFSYTEKGLSIEEDKDNGTITETESYTDCEDGGTLVEESYDDKYFYVIKDGSMVRWSSWDCFAQKYTGSGDSYLNTDWTFDSIVEIPTDHPTFGEVDTWCSDESIADYQNDEFSELKVKYTDSSTIYTGTEILCAADMIMSDDSEMGVTWKKTDCSELSATVGEDTVDFKITKMSGEYANVWEFALNITYRGTTCSYAEKETQGEVSYTEKQCADAWAEHTLNPVDEYFYIWDYIEDDEANEEEFEKCVMEAGIPETVFDFF